MRKIICYLIILICFSGCKSQIKSNTNVVDTNQIITRILNYRSLSKDLKSDTIFIVKSNLVNESWPSKTDIFKLVYIESDKKNDDLINLSPTSFYDKRVRMDFGKFISNGDTTHVSFGVYELQKITIYDYKLVFNKNSWLISDAKKRKY